MNILTALLPVIGWGIMPIIANIKSVSTYTQLLGVSISAFFFSLVFTVIVKPDITLFSFMISFISGIFWSVGQFYQFKGIKQSSVSKAMPISNGSQLILTALLGVLLFQEWKENRDYFIGIIAITIITLGIVKTSFSETKGRSSIKESFFSILISSAFLAFYVLINKIFQIDSYAIFLPQSIGMIVCSSILYKKNHPSYISLKNFFFPILSGIAWALANIGMFLTNEALGVSLGYAISQCCVVVSTLGGIFIFREVKTSKEWRSILIGILLIIMGISCLTFLI